MPERSQRKYIQWNEILRDVLNRKLKIVQNKNAETDNESEEGEKEDDESDFKNHDEKDGHRSISTSSEDELNLHTDGDLTTGETKEKIISTKNQKTRRSNRESK